MKKPEETYTVNLGGCELLYIKGESRNGKITKLTSLVIDLFPPHCSELDEDVKKETPSETLLEMTRIIRFSEEPPRDEFEALNRILPWPVYWTWVKQSPREEYKRSVNAFLRSVSGDNLVWLPQHARHEIADRWFKKYFVKIIPQEFLENFDEEYNFIRVNGGHLYIAPMVDTNKLWLIVKREWFVWATDFLENISSFGEFAVKVWEVSKMWEDKIKMIIREHPEVISFFFRFFDKPSHFNAKYDKFVPLHEVNKRIVEIIEQIKRDAELH